MKGFGGRVLTSLARCSAREVQSRLPVSLHQHPQPKDLALASNVVEGYCLFVSLPMLIYV